MARSQNAQSPAPATTGNGAIDPARDAAEGMLIEMSTPAVGETIADAWGHLAGFVMVGSGTFASVPVRVPGELDFEARARYIISEVEALAADKDHVDFTAAMIHANAGRGHDKLKTALDEGLRFAAETALVEAGDDPTPGNVTAAVNYFIQSYSDPDYRTDINQRMSTAVLSFGSRRKDRKQTRKAEAVSTKIAGLLVKRSAEAS